MLEKLWNLIRTGTILEHRPGKEPINHVRIGDEEDTLVFPHFEPFGFCSYPLPGSETLLLSPGGSYEFTYSAMTIDRSREKPFLEPGDAAIYSSKETYFKCSNDGSLELRAKRFAIKNDNIELLKLLSQIFDAIESSSFAGQTPVKNTQLSPLLRQLEQFTK